MAIILPHGVLFRGGEERAIRKGIIAEDLLEAVIGLPLDLSGAEGAWAAEVRQFGDDLARRTGLPVHWMDERLSSVRAERAVRGMGLRKSAREEKERIDAAAAALILEGFLALRRNRTEGESGAGDAD